MLPEQLQEFYKVVEVQAPDTFAPVSARQTIFCFKIKINSKQRLPQNLYEPGSGAGTWFWHWDTYMDDDRLYDRSYLKARQDHDDEAAHNMDAAPQHPLPFDLIAKAHGKRGVVDLAGNFQGVKLNDVVLANGITVKRRKIKRFKNGDVETTEVDGSKEFVRVDGSIVKTSADGTMTEETPDEKATRDKEAIRLEKLRQRARNLGSYQVIPEPGANSSLKPCTSVHFCTFHTEPITPTHSVCFLDSRFAQYCREMCLYCERATIISSKEPETRTQ